MHESYDVCVVGGGAAGMSAAIAAAQQGKKVCILDKNKKLGKKLYATGNGRCNLANADTKRSHYHSVSFCDNSDTWEQFLAHCMGTDSNASLFSFLHTIGIYERECSGYYYPSSLQASSVVWAFLDALHALSVTIMETACVTAIKKTEQGYCLYRADHTDPIEAGSVILTCGGRTYTSLGGGTEGYEILKNLDIPVSRLRPSLCGVYTKEETEEIKGVRVLCSARIDGKKDTKQQGELQITEYGLSGIMMFNLSSEIGRLLAKNEKPLIVFNFLEQIDRETFVHPQEIRRTLLGYLNSFLPDKLASYVIKACGLQPKQGLETITNRQLTKLYDTCRRFEFHAVKLKDFESAQVTAGGICLEAVNPDTMELFYHPGMYAAGEILDIHGDCGGYNLTFAILTGLRAGSACK